MFVKLKNSFIILKHSFSNTNKPWKINYKNQCLQKVFNVLICKKVDTTKHCSSEMASFCILLTKLLVLSFEKEGNLRKRLTCSYFEEVYAAELNSTKYEDLTVIVAHLSLPSFP